MQNDLLQWQITQSEKRLRKRKIKPSQIKFHQSLPTRRASTERRKTKKYLFNNFVWNDLPQGQIRQREKGLREKNVKCPKSNFIRVCLKERFHRNLKFDLGHLTFFSFSPFMNFDLGYFPLFSLSLSSLCVIYHRGRSVHKKIKLQ